MSLPTASIAGIFLPRDITKAMDGLVPGKPVVKFEWRGRGKELAAESKEGNLQYIVGAKLTRKGRFTPNEAPFLKQHAPGPFKVCTPAAMQHAIMRYRPGVSDKFYPTVHDMLQDVAAIMRHEVQALIDEGAAYVQLDAPSYSNFFDQSRRTVLTQSGIDLAEALDAAIAADNAMIDGIKRNSDVAMGIHFCRGNKRSAWGAEGGYVRVDRREGLRLTQGGFAIYWSSTATAPAASSRCVSCPRARPWCWA